MTGVSRLGSRSESKMSRLDFSIVRLSFYYVFSLKSEEEDLPWRQFTTTSEFESSVSLLFFMAFLWIMWSNGLEYSVGNNTAILSYFSYHIV
jgi:hypothetical protein